MSCQAALIAHYTFDVDGTDAFGNHATLGDAASITASSKVGAGALSLSGAPSPDGGGNDGAYSGSDFTLGDHTRTIAFWMKATAGDHGDVNSTLISLGDTSANGTRFDIRVTGNKLRFEVGGGGTTTGATIADGSWHHIAIVVPTVGATVSASQYSIDGGTLTAFGGTTGATTVGINTVDNPLRLGESVVGTDDRDYKGLIDEVRIYDEALSQSAITALASVPEPSSAALLGLGGLALILRRRKG